MEPHAAQDRLSFVCNWKHMHSEAKTKAEPPQPTSPHTHTHPRPIPHLLLLSCVWGATFWSGPSGRPQHRVWENLLNQMTWWYTSNSVQWDNCIMCPASLSSPWTGIWVTVESLWRMVALTLSLTCFENSSSTVQFIRHGLWCLDGTGHGRMAGQSSPTLTSLLCTGVRLHKRRMFDIY